MEGLIMEELTMRDYPLGVLENLIGSRGKEAVERKLTKYGYGFTSVGRGKQRIYTITSLPNAQARFKSYCVFALGFDGNTDFRKLRDFVFYLENDLGFSGMPDEMMEEYLRLEGRGMSSQTIGKYRRHLVDLGLIAPMGDFVYYKVKKHYGVQEHEIITADEYNKAWKSYHKWRASHPDEDSRPAYAHMYNEFGGVPRKQATIVGNALYTAELNTLFDLATNSIMEELDG